MASRDIDLKSPLPKDREPLPYRIRVERTLLAADRVPFVSRSGTDPKALAMNIDYVPVLSARDQISKFIDRELHFFTDWDPGGEAHITTVTRSEWEEFFKDHIQRRDLDKWAAEEALQKRKFKVAGIGSFSKFLGGSEPETTFFFIVESKDLIKVRKTFKTRLEMIMKSESAFQPENFYPHITIGFTKQDFHERDGALKDKAHCFDPRFVIDWKG